MNTSIIRRFITILMFLMAQLSMPCLTFAFVVILSIYLLNLFFIQPDKAKYFEETYLYITISFFLTAVFIYISLISTFLNFIKFGKTRFISKLIDIPYLITPEMKLYYYNLTGQSVKALKVASKMVLTSKMFMTKLLVSDAFYLDKKYKKALKLINTGDNPREVDLAMAKKALIIAKSTQNFEEAYELIDDAIEINQNMVVRNSEVKYFELSLIKAEIYLLAEEIDKGLDILNYWNEATTKYLFFYKAKYSAYFMSQYFLLCAQAFIKKEMEREKILYLLDKSIKTFPDALPAKEAKKLKDKLEG